MTVRLTHQRLAKFSRRRRYLALNEQLDDVAVANDNASYNPVDDIPELESPVDSELSDSLLLRSRLISEEPLTWMFLGDEFTGWSAFSNDQGYVDFLEQRIRRELRRLPDTFINRAMNGACLNQFSGVLSSLADHFKPSIIMFMLGWQDVPHWKSNAQEFVQIFRQFISQIRESSAIPIAITYPESGTAHPIFGHESLCQMNQTIRKVALNENLLLIDPSMESQVSLNSNHPSSTAELQALCAHHLLCQLDLYDRQSEICHQLDQLLSRTEGIEQVSDPVSAVKH